MEASRQDILKGLSLIQELAIQLRVSKECLATSNFYFQKVINKLSIKYYAMRRPSLTISQVLVFLLPARL